MSPRPIFRPRWYSIFPSPMALPRAPSRCRQAPIGPSRYSPSMPGEWRRPSGPSKAPPGRRPSPLPRSVGRVGPRSVTAALPRRIGLALLVAIGACSEPTGSGRRPVDASLLVRADLSATGVMTVVVEVPAADIPTPLVFNTPVVVRLASGPATIPSGSKRTITIPAFDPGGVQPRHVTDT